MHKISIGLTLLLALTLTNSCKKSAVDLLFSVEDDKKLGKQVADEIAADPQQFPILDSAQYATAYAHIYRIRDSVLNSGQMKHKNDFVWQVRIVKDDNTLNAFCTPGGYIYFYTGLIKYLDNEHELAGVMGHEIAHADQRHTTQQLLQQYAVGTLLDVVLGKNNGLLKEIAAGLILLKYSRSHETDADEHSVKYLCPTAYEASGAAAFFEKISGSPQPPEFLSTHPNPDRRVENIRAKDTELGCSGTGTYPSRYQDFKNSLP